MAPEVPIINPTPDRQRFARLFVLLPPTRPKLGLIFEVQQFGFGIKNLSRNPKKLMRLYDCFHGSYPRS